MLEHIESRTGGVPGRNHSRKQIIHIHEKEREFFDAIRLIIQNGYCLKPHYTNPHLSNAKLMDALDEYMEVTKPQRYIDDIDKSIQ